MIKGAIFDLDGTLLDSMEEWDKVAENYLISRGKTVNEDLAAVCKSMTMEELARYCIDKYGLSDSTESVVDGLNALVESFYYEKAPLKSGVADFLSYLYENGAVMCVATVTDEYLVDAALKRLGVRHYFCEIFTCAKVGKGKEEPDIYRAALNRLGTDRKDTVVFEDVIHAVRTAKSDGFTVAAVYDRFETDQAGMKALSDYYVTDFSGFRFEQ